jgi:hypothetical protein
MVAESLRSGTSTGATSSASSSRVVSDTCNRNRNVKNKASATVSAATASASSTPLRISSCQSIMLILAACSAATQTSAFSTSSSSQRNTFFQNNVHVNSNNNYQRKLVTTNLTRNPNPLSFVMTPERRGRGIQHQSQHPSSNQFQYIHSNYQITSATTPSTSTALFSETTENTNTSKTNQEWNALVASFKMYKAAYGDLKVPSRFVVPSIPPWPGKFV